MTISACEDEWDRRLLTAFRRRISVELRDIDLLEFLGNDPFKSIGRWCARWNYSPILVGLRNIKFLPNEMLALSVGT